MLASSSERSSPFGDSGRVFPERGCLLGVVKGDDRGVGETHGKHAPDFRCARHQVERGALPAVQPTIVVNPVEGVIN